MTNHRFLTKAEQKLNKQGALNTAKHPTPRGQKLLIDVTIPPKHPSSYADSVISENLEKEIKELTKKFTNEGKFRVYIPKKGFGKTSERFFFVEDEAGDKELWKLINALPESIKEHYTRIVWPFAVVVEALKAQVLRDSQESELQAAFEKIMDKKAFDLRPGTVIMGGNGGLGQPDVVKFEATKLVAVNEAEEEKLWAWIDSLPEWVGKQVANYCCRIKDLLSQPQHKEEP